jgi:hypothetical protein
LQAVVRWILALAEEPDMSNPNGRKGSAFETACIEYLREHGFPYAERRVSNGTRDRGDLGGVPGMVLEMKNHKTIDLAGFMDEVAIEKANAHAQIGAAVIKRRNHGIERAYVVEELQFWLPRTL